MKDRTIIMEVESDYNLLTILNECLNGDTDTRYLVLVRNCFRGAAKKCKIINEGIKGRSIEAYVFEEFATVEYRFTGGIFRRYSNLISGSLHGKKQSKRIIDRLKLENVDEYWCANVSIENKMLCSEIKRRFTNAKVYLYEEGISFYGENDYFNSDTFSFKHSLYMKLFGVRDIVREIEAAYCFRPDEVLWKSTFPLKQLAPISVDNIRCLNEIFAYDEGSGKEYDSGIIYMNQPFSKDGMDIDDSFIVNELRKVFREKVKVKSHPRTEDLCYGDSLKYIDDHNIWEVVCGNTDFKNSVLLTVSSQSVLAPYLLYEKRVPVVFLYNIFDKGIRVPGRKYLDNCIRPKQYDFYYFPNTVDEAVRCIKELLYD